MKQSVLSAPIRPGAFADPDSSHYEMEDADGKRNRRERQQQPAKYRNSTDGIEKLYESHSGSEQGDGCPHVCQECPLIGQGCPVYGQ